MSQKPIKLAVWANHPLFKDILINYLTQKEDFEINIEVSCFGELVERLECSQIDVLLVDVIKPKGQLYDLLNTLIETQPDIKIVAITLNPSMEFVDSLISLGIHNCVSLANDPEALGPTIRSAYQDKNAGWLISEGPSRRGERSRRGINAKASTLLNDREREILKLMWEEKSNKEIAKLVFLSVRSVEKIRLDMKEKLGVKSTVGLLKYAITRDIISVEQIPLFYY